MSLIESKIRRTGRAYGRALATIRLAPFGSILLVFPGTVEHVKRQTEMLGRSDLIVRGYEPGPARVHREPIYDELADSIHRDYL